MSPNSGCFRLPYFSMPFLISLDMRFILSATVSSLPFSSSSCCSPSSPSSLNTPWYPWASAAAIRRSSSFSTLAMISEHRSRYLASIMLAGIRNWYVVASSLGRNALRTSPVSALTGLPFPRFAMVSVGTDENRSNRYGLSGTLPSGM